MRTDLRLVEPGVALVVPHVLPGHQRPGMKRISLAIVRRTMQRALLDLGSPSVRAVVVTSLDPCFGACDERQKVFYASDDFIAGADLMRISPRRLERDLQRQPAEADLVVAISPRLADGFRDRGYEPLMIPNGCDPEIFAGTDQAEPVPGFDPGGPVAGFMGHLSDRIDVRYLEAIAARGHDLLLVGPGPSSGLGDGLRALVGRSNVEWVGPQEFARLPRYLRMVDVGLVPYADTPFNHASFPLKALEYLAAGRPVLSTDIDAIHWLARGENIGLTPQPRLPITADDIVVAGTPELFADAAERLLVTPRDQESIARRQAFARAHSWTSRFAVLAAALGHDTSGQLPETSTR
jgi:glycosyltransferase involved in cell wall biosynthesis